MENELLNSEKIEDLFYYNFKGEFDWSMTLQFISNRNNFSFYECNLKDSKDRLYKIRNLIKELPTYSVLNKRGVNEITEDLCPRCRKFNEDWEHVWDFGYVRIMNSQLESL